MNTKVMFSSKRDNWETPQELIDNLGIKFDLDVCATKNNAKADRYFTPEIDGLKQDWHGICWMNPPYGKEIGKWVEKAYKESQKKDTAVIALLPARTDTKWFHDYCLKASNILFIKGRVTFVGASHPAPFPSMIVCFKGA